MSFAFFNALFPDPGSGRDLGYVVLATYPEGSFTAGSGPTQTHFFPWPSQRDQLVAFCLANSEKDIYTSAALYKTRGNRDAENIAHQWAVISDADTLPLDKVKIEPTLVIQTSPGRHHLYWVTSTDDVARTTAVSRAIAMTHADDGCDKGGWDAGQLLRVPGTTNNKYNLYDGSAIEVQLKRTGSTYDLAKLETVYPPVESQPVEAVGDMPPRSEWHNTAAVLAEAKTLFDYSPVIADMFHTPLNRGGVRVDRSDTMWRFLGELARNGASHATAMYLCWEAPFCKYRLDGRGEEAMWNELCRAFADPENKPVTNSLEAAERVQLDRSENNPTHKVRALIDKVSLLSPAERAKVPSDTVVDAYVQWARTCTDAPDTYHRSGALSLLTSVFGEFGRCPLPRDANLTLWFMILGPTTRARKTTSMNLWIDILADLQDTRYNYLLGSDVTAEALSVVLPKKDGRTSVFFRDEAHGLFSEQDKKNYMAGLRERFTDLYGGRVPVALRVSTMSDDEDKAPSVKARTNFIMFLAGTMNQIAEVLTIKDYQSGHLARFILADADPPPMTEQGMYTEQYDGSEESFDGLRHTLLNRLTDARNFWQDATPPGTLKLIPFEGDAWQRVQKAQWQLYEPTIHHEMHDVMEATAKRMGDSMLKAAVLLAMSERAQKVTLLHVYKAMELAEEWYANAITVAGRIMHSSWSARQEEVLAMIRGRTDGVTQAEVFARFRHKMKEQEIESDLNVLIKAGLIRKSALQGRVRYNRITRG